RQRFVQRTGATLVQSSQALRTIFISSNRRSFFIGTSTQVGSLPRLAEAGLPTRGTGSALCVAGADAAAGRSGAAADAASSVEACNSIISGQRPPAPVGACLQVLIRPSIFSSAM